MDGISLHFSALQSQTSQHNLPTFQKTLQVQPFPMKSSTCFFVLKWRIFPKKSARKPVACHLDS
jgi:hypothetical protein